MFVSAPELSEEEKKMIILSDEFHKFFDKTSRYVERALAEDTDIFVDYAGALERDTETLVSCSGV